MKKYFRGDVRRNENTIIARIDVAQLRVQQNESVRVRQRRETILTWHIDPAVFAKWLSQPVLPAQNSEQENIPAMFHGVAGRYSYVPRCGQHRSGGEIIFC